MCLLAACCVVPAVGQDWKEALKSAASNVVDKATGGKATETLMIGDWQYEAPGVKLESDNALADVGASAVTGKNGGAARKALRAGGYPCRCVQVLVRGGPKRFTATFGSRTFTGTYEFTGESHDIALHFEMSSKYDLGTLNGKTYLSGTDLQILFPATRLLKMVDVLGQKLASFSTTAATVSTLVGKFDDLYLGFEFTKQ